MARPRKTVTPADPGLTTADPTTSDTAQPAAGQGLVPQSDAVADPVPDSVADDALLELVDETAHTQHAPADDTPKPTPAEPEPPRKRAPLPVAAQVAALVVGGAVAAGLGYGAGRLTAPTAANAPLAQTVDQQARDIADLRAALAEQQPVAAPDLTPLTDRIAALEARVANAPTATGPDLSAELASLRDQVDTLAKNGGEDAQRIKTAADQAQAAISAAEAQATALSDRARAELTLARRQSAIGRIQAALDTGAAYGQALADLGGDLPDVLKTHAERGLPTLASLRSAWPDAARAALNAALRARAGADWADRISLFFRTQTGARSLTPKEGDDPDAILSRAGAALDKNDLATCLAEIAKLPAEGQLPLADFVTLAQTRLAATDAIAALAAAQ